MVNVAFSTFLHWIKGSREISKVETATFILTVINTLSFLAKTLKRRGFVDRPKKL
jgi:hypothetical protein